MPYLLILLSLFILSCKNDNVIRGNAPILRSNENPSKIENNKPLPYISNFSQDSKLRQKILNSFVESSFPSNNTNFHIQTREELVGFGMNTSQLSDYRNQEETMVKLIVSYTDHTDVYFINRGKILDDISTELQIEPEQNRKFFWLKTNIENTISETYILVSLNIEDIVINDRNFYQSSITYTFNQSNNNTAILVPKGAVASGKLIYASYLQNEKLGERSEELKCRLTGGTMYKCYCTYNMPEAATTFAMVTAPNIEDIDLDIKIDGQVFNIDRFNPSFESAGKVSFSIDPEEMNGEQFKFRIGKVQDEWITKTGSGSNYKMFLCKDQNKSETYQLKKKFEYTLELMVSGRGFEKLKNVL